MLFVPLTPLSGVGVVICLMSNLFLTGLHLQLVVVDFRCHCAQRHVDVEEVGLDVPLLLFSFDLALSGK